MAPIPASRPATGKGSSATVGGRSRSASGQGAKTTLCVDIGGSGVKGGAVDGRGRLIGDRVRVPTTYPLTPQKLVEIITVIARQSPPTDRASLGFPGMVRAGKILSAPHYVGRKGPGSKPDDDLVAAWAAFPLAQTVGGALDIPCRLANDAEVQGLAAITGKGLELVITLGTGVGTGLYLDGQLAPHLEIAQHPLQGSKTYNGRIGDDARKKAGNKKWSRRVDEAIGTLAGLVFYDTLYIGGGNASKLTKHFTREATIIDNADGILGGVQLWSQGQLP